MRCRLSDGHSNDYFIAILEILTMTNAPSNANTSDALVGAFLEVDGERYGGEEIRRLYDSADFPLIRRAAA
jgi:hypothetical protein